MTGGGDRGAAVAPGGAEIAGREEILRTLLKAGVAAILLTLAILLVIEGERVDFWPYATLLASHAGVLALLRAGWLRLAVLTHASAYIATILAVLLFYGGLKSPAAFVFPPIVLLVGLTWSGRAALATAAACSLGLVSLLLLSARQGRLERGEITYGIVATVVLALTGVVLALALRTIARAQERSLAAERGERALLERLHGAQRLETVSRLAAGVAHDFNNLLNVIVGQAGLLARHPEEKVASQARQIESAAWRAADLTQKLLAVGRKQSLASRGLELNEVVLGVEPLLKRSIEDAGRIRFDLAGEPLHLHADQTLLEQILLNLVRNAGDATPRDGEIRIRTAAISASELERLPAWASGSGSAVLLEVADNGTGMTPEQQKHLFEPFYTTKEPGRGTGLGLASVYGVVQQSGGAITVESARGVGTTFRIYLPEVAAG